MAIKTLFALKPEGRSAIGANSAFEIRFDDATGAVTVLVDGVQTIAEQGAAVATVTGTADATYSANETTLINDLTTAVNAILARLRAHGIIAT